MAVIVVNLFNSEIGWGGMGWWVGAGGWGWVLLSIPLGCIIIMQDMQYLFYTLLGTSIMSLWIWVSLDVSVNHLNFSC